MAWQKKFLSRFNRNGDMAQPLKYTDGDTTVDVVAILNAAGDIVTPASAALQESANSLLTGMSASMASTANSMTTMSTAVAATLESRVKSGNAYIASVGKMGLLGTLLNLKTTIENPANSGKVLYIYALEVAQDGLTLLWPTLMVNPNASLPANSAGTSKFNQNPSSLNSTVAVIKTAAEAVAMSGGTALGVIPLPSGRQVYRDHIYVLPPGTMLGMNLVGAIGLNAMVRTFYWEEPV